ncbi:MAG TPA: hypothetical protein VH062_24240 [Polyangiaceae bacterium]|jgi:hypothetical protein|nr:hypothetical protein [Polyangiaceae bacterium]
MSSRLPSVRPRLAALALRASPLVMTALLGFAACARDPASGSKIDGSDIKGGAGGAAGASHGSSGGDSTGAGASSSAGRGTTGSAGTSSGASGTSPGSAGRSGDGSDGGPTGGGTAGSSPTDAGSVPGCGQSIEGLGSCGQQSVGARIRHPQMLIVMDKSGSMTDQPAGFDVSIWDGVKAALKTSLEAVAGRVSFGLELFPFPSDASHPIALDCTTNCCEMPATPDINVPIESGTTALPKILAALDATSPGGGTPTAVALHRAYEYFTKGAGAALSGEKYVMLATDGGPNCNTGLTCDSAGCSTNLEGHCTGSLNCCANYGQACVDDAATTAELEALHAAGIATFVVGIPGSEAYSRFLDGFAVSGGETNPKAPPSYYRVDAAAGVAGLTNVFSDITTQLVTACELDLEMPPVDPRQVNVAIDCNVVPSGGDGPDGWRLDVDSDPARVLFEGTLCRYMQTEGAHRVDIVFGCPTVR